MAPASPDLRATWDALDIERFEGMISTDEARLLYSLGAFLEVGSIVEIGSWRGKSAIALARGAATRAAEARPMVYCVEPHSAFVGIYGGKFQASDRGAFYRAMLDAGCADGVALINLDSVSAARAWQGPIGLLFIDGDHTDAGVSADVAAWSPYVVDGGYIAFDDATDAAAGPFHSIAKMLLSEEYRISHEVGKIVVLQKVPRALQLEAQESRASAMDDLRGRARAVGYDGETALSRLSYGSFVSLKNKYMYVETPKAACTSIKQLVAELEGVEVDMTTPPYQEETRRDMLIHQRRSLPIPTLLDIEVAARSQILNDTGDWFVFAVTRNPYSRLVAVFENKIRLGEPGYEDLQQRFGDSGPFQKPGLAFRAFIEEIVSDQSLRSQDAHLMSQDDLLMPGLIPYSALYKLDHVAEAVEGLKVHLERNGSALKPVLERHNKSISRPWRNYYDQRSAQIVAAAYETDFKKFGYEVDDWRGGESDFEESDSERSWRAEVVARNDLIHLLYGWLGRATKS